MKRLFYLLLLLGTATQVWATPAHFRMDPDTLQCSADVINRGDTIYSTLNTLDVACLEINIEAGFVVEGGASYEAQIVEGAANARMGVGGSEGILSVVSPTAASLGKFADIPVNYNNGLPQISIPITTVREAELQLPVTLQYHASGVKVEEVASWVGLNWTLSAGGVINRQVMGGPDESYEDPTHAGQKGQVPTTSNYNTYTGYYADGGFSAFQPFLVCTPIEMATPPTQSLLLGDTFLGAALGLKDTEPDLFTFNVAGYTGKFYFDNQRQVHLIPQQDVKIVVNFDNANKQFNTWTLVTPDGMRYHFGENNAYDISRSAVGSDQLVTTGTKLRSTWHLTRVESADHQRNIYLEYEAETVNTHALSSEKFIRNVLPYEGLTTDKRVTTTQIEAKRLSQIYSSSTQVLFHADNLRTDIHTTLSNAKRLDEIEVKAQNQTSCLRYKLSYDYWQSPAAGSGDLPASGTSDQSDFKRLRLLSVQEFSCDLSLSKPAYTFSYAGGNLPRRLSYQRDHWGYFNAESNNNSLIPSAEAQSTFIISDRSADATLQKRGHLYQITYPTGGFTRFAMEAHTGKGGLRVQRMAEYFSPTDSVVRTFEYSSPLEPFQHLYTQQVPSAVPSGWDTYIQPQNGQQGCPRQGSGVLNSINFDCLLNKVIVGSHLFGELAALSGGAIGYQEVRVNHLGSGYSLYKYNLEQYTELYAQINTFPVVADRALYYVANGTLDTEEHYNESNQIQRKTVYEYNPLQAVEVTTAPAIKFVAETCEECVGQGCDPVRTTVFFKPYDRQTVRQLLLKKTEYHYNLDGSGELTDATIYTYGNQHEQAIRTERQTSRGDMLISETRFVRDLITNETDPFTGDAYPLLLMRQYNMNVPVEQLTFIKKATESEAQKKAIAGSYTRFGVINSDIQVVKPITHYSLKVPDAVSITPVSVSGGTLTYAGSQYETRMNFTYYTSSGSKGLLETESAEKGTPTRYTYTTKRLLESRTESFGIGHSQTTYYTHDALFGPTQIQNPRGLNTNFLYDGLGRLYQIKDHATDLVKEYDYQYFSYPSTPINSVTEFTPRMASSSLPSGIANLQTTIGYVDGLGRALQNVGKEAGPNGSSDIVVNAQTYDVVGRPKRTYVAFSNAGSGGLAALPTTVHGDTAPYSENSLFDNSPLKRATKAYGPGQTWRTADKAVLMNYGTAGSEVRKYEVTSTGASSSGNFYTNATLFKKTTTNERGLNTVEFTDKNGQVVERWTPDTTGGNYLITSYVYDDLGRLRYVLPPKAQPSLTTFTESSGDFAEGLYGYKYDRRGRVIEKHIPGADWEYIVYDVLDRPVLRQNARQREGTDKRWTFTKYDFLGRVVQTGETINANSRDALQTLFDGVTIPYETTVGGPQSFPITLAANDLQTETYYDNYASLPSGYTYSGGYLAPHFSATGLATGGRVRNPITNGWLYSATYYDYKDRVVQQHRQNHLGAGPVYGIDRTDFDYTFPGEVTKQRTTYRRTGASDLVILHEYEYDHVGRKKKYFHSIDNTRVEVANYNYDAVGRLIEKKLRPDRTYQKLGDNPLTITRATPPPANTTDIASQWILLDPGFNTTATGSNTYLAQIGAVAGAGTVQGLQTIQYSYHIRNWLTGINGGSLNHSENDLFGYQLEYETDGAYFDGNIRKQTWVTKRDQQVRSYTYRYDLANRLTYTTYAGAGNENYRTQGISYDRNGNITHLHRQGLRPPTTYGSIDQLTYTYAANSNKLLSVTDAITDNTDVGDFRDGNTGSNDYEYWPNGSLKKDLNKAMTVDISYNYLELTTQVTTASGTLQTWYDGAGGKLRKTVNGTTTDYVGEMILVSNQIYQLVHGEGRAVPNGGNWLLEFNYLDHLGNLRLAFRDSLGSAVSGVYPPPVITQINAYADFGIPLRGLDYTNSSQSNKFTFNGKEIEESLG